MATTNQTYNCPYLSHTSFQMRSLEIEMRRVLSMLSRNINSYDSIVYRLPPELLREIIFLLSDEDLITATHV